MADESPTPKVVEAIPSIRGGLSAIGSANAPFIYFENVPFYGLLNGVGQLTLDANRLYGADSDGKPIYDRVIVAHIRCNLPAIRSLRAAIDGILLMAEPKPEGPAN
jgi:hypothetical protein